MLVDFIHPYFQILFVLIDVSCLEVAKLVGKSGDRSNSLADDL
ncbi:hypothetical protein [Nostoc sp. LEGE 06077]|nr:hypothetical protein [Nostoc sp. LEGE 06077]